VSDGCFLRKLQGPRDPELAPLQLMDDGPIARPIDKGLVQLQPEEGASPIPSTTSHRLPASVQTP